MTDQYFFLILKYTKDETDETNDVYEKVTLYSIPDNKIFKKLKILIFEEIEKSIKMTLTTASASVSTTASVSTSSPSPEPAYKKEYDTNYPYIFNFIKLDRKQLIATNDDYKELKYFHQGYLNEIQTHITNEKNGFMKKDTSGNDTIMKILEEGKKKYEKRFIDNKNLDINDVTYYQKLSLSYSEKMEIYNKNVILDDRDRIIVTSKDNLDENIKYMLGKMFDDSIQTILVDLEKESIVPLKKEVKPVELKDIKLENEEGSEEGSEKGSEYRSEDENEYRSKDENEDVNKYEIDDDFDDNIYKLIEETSSKSNQASSKSNQASSKSNQASSKSNPAISSKSLSEKISSKSSSNPAISSISPSTSSKKGPLNSITNTNYTGDYDV